MRAVDDDRGAWLYMVVGMMAAVFQELLEFDRRLPECPLLVGRAIPIWSVLWASNWRWECGFPRLGRFFRISVSRRNNAGRRGCGRLIPWFTRFIAAGLHSGQVDQLLVVVMREGMPRV